MLSQIVRNNTTQSKDLRTKATKYSDTFKVEQEQSDDMNKLAEYIKQHIAQPEKPSEVTCEDLDYIVENPDEVVVEFSNIYKEKEVQLPFFRSIQAQLKEIYG
ncbi:hypothetical protein IJ579_01895 [bacterium]|nr:hypothetical protein [bacterium]